MATTAQRLAEYEDLYRKAQSYDPNAYQNEFEKSYGEATNYNKDLIEQQSSALGEVQAVAPTLREKYMNTLVTDPAAQMSLIAQARQAPITSYGTAANLLNARGNRYQDILGKALGGYQTSANQANTAAENAWRMYQDAVQQDQFNRQLNKGTGNGGPSSFEQMLMDYINGQNGQRVETKPNLPIAQQKTIDAIRSLAEARKRGNLVKPIDYHVNNIITQARTKFGLNLNPQAVWQQVGNDEGPQSLSLFR